MAAEIRDTIDTVAKPLVDEPAGDDERAEGPPQRGVYGRLFREGYRFNFYQAVRLLEKYFADAPAPGETSEVRRERIFFRPDVALTFPASDVRRVEALDEADRARVTVTFMGLYGIASPLPVYFYDELATEEPDTFPLRDFLDIFDHRLYSYFYRAWKKYRPEINTEQPDRDVHAKRFLGLAGLGTAHALDRSPVANRMRLAAFAGRLSPRVRNAEGLRAVLAGLLKGIEVRIEENVARWVPIPSRPTMSGGGMQLGVTTTIGEKVFDRAGKFRVVLGPITFAQYRELLPGGDLARRIAYLVRLYAPDYLDYDVEIHLNTDDIPRVRLGEKAVSVGQTTWLGSPADEVTVQHLDYE